MAFFLPFAAHIRYHFPMTKLFLAVLLVLAGCGENKKESKLHKISEEVIPQYVNQKALPEDPNLTLDKSILNRSYPIQIALYNDGQFYYDLPNLGDGHGTWKNAGGILKLKAKRPIFDMHIEVEANDPEGKSLSIQFSDRFGPKTLKMRNVNIED